MNAKRNCLIFVLNYIVLFFFLKNILVKIVTTALAGAPLWTKKDPFGWLNILFAESVNMLDNLKKNQLIS